jgi:hypothetical protein
MVVQGICLALESARSSSMDESRLQCPKCNCRIRLKVRRLLRANRQRAKERGTVDGATLPLLALFSNAEF